ncbi:transposase DDE domain protein [Rhodococcus sp. MTM3W5.2]|nr:transposase DDE domain protein [Rhodococcus sp. MTM3W5.2]
MRKGYRIPTAHCDLLGPDTECGCAKTVTLSDEDFPNIRMPFQHGSEEWAASYHRRVGIESLFGDLKTNRLHVRRGYLRIFGLTRHQLLLGFTLAAMNLMILREGRRKGQGPDLWAELLGEPEPPRQSTQRRRRATRSDGGHSTGDS